MNFLNLMPIFRRFWQCGSVILASLMLIGCGASLDIEYDGIEYPPTNEIIVYGDLSEIDQPMEIMGYMHAWGRTLASRSKMRKQLIKEAKKRGADAILIEGMGKVMVQGKKRQRGMGYLSMPHKEKWERAILIKFK